MSGLKVKTGLAVNKIFRRFVERKLQTEAIDIARRENKEEGQKLEKKAKRRSRKSKGVELGIEFSTERLSGEAWTHKYRPRSVSWYYSEFRFTFYFNLKSQFILYLHIYFIILPYRLMIHCIFKFMHQLIHIFIIA